MAEGKFIQLEDGWEIPGFKGSDYNVSRKPYDGPARPGRGKTKLTTRMYTEAEKQTICLLRGKGLTHEEIAAKMHRSEGSIKEVLKSAARSAKLMGIDFDWKEDLREKSVFALRKALIHEGKDADVYKAGNLAVQTLKGTGDLQSEGAANLAVVINSIPANMRDRYVSLDEPQQIEGDRHEDAAATSESNSR